MDVYLVTPQDGSPDAVYLSIDGGTVELLMPCILPLDVYQNEVLPAVKATDADEEDSFNAKKFQAFYCIKDPADPALMPREVAEMQALIPIWEFISTEVL